MKTQVRNASWRYCALALISAAALTGCETISQQPAAPQGAPSRAPAVSPPASAPAPTAAAPFSGPIPLQTYASYLSYGIAFSYQLQPGGKLIFRDYNEGKLVERRNGTWTQTGNRITLSLPRAKSQKALSYVYEYRNELRSPDPDFEGCRQFAPGLYPISDNGKPIKKEFFTALFLWPDRYTLAKGPCLSRR